VALVKLETGDIAVATEELNRLVTLLKDQEQTYLRQPAVDNFEKMVSQNLSDRAKARREALERVMGKLSEF
jgi:Tfp pilus assembly pilus retraction ATPase PilT